MAKILNNIVEDNAGFFRKTFPVSKELDSGKWKWLSNLYKMGYEAILF